ncbi:MAG: sugar ABC transporter permease [Anaerolineae bacterium]|nr:sugar ABC transporter permease [Anaerolineae bacterium]
MMLWPLANMFRVSMFEWRRLTSPQTFVGLANYIELFQDPKILVALGNTLRHMIVMLLFVMPISFMLGFFLSQRLRGYRVLRTIFFLPAMLSAPALALIFLGVYLPDGILNHVLRAVGLESWTRVWLANASTSLPAVIAADAWGALGFYTVLFFVALSDLPPELFESAQLDGANYWIAMWQIGFPLILDFFGVALTLNFVWTLTGSAQYVLLLTKGGPGTSSLTLSYYLYDKAFLTYQIGYSQAIGVLLLFAGMIGILLTRRLTHRNYSV